MIYTEDLSAELSAIGLERLHSGGVDADFYDITSELIATQNPSAMAEGRLLKIGGDLHDQDTDLSSAFINLAIAHSLYMESGLMRPIGHKILEHLTLLPSGNEALTLRLETLQELSQAAESTS